MTISKTPLILFLISLLNENRTSESIYPHKSLSNDNPFHARSLTDHLLASLAGMTSAGHHNQHPFLYTMKQIPFQTSSSFTSPSSWLYQLPFATGSAQCDQSLMLEPEFHRCRANAAVYWQQGLTPNHQYQQQSSSSNKHTCCFLWDLVDCMEEAIRRRCNYSLDIFRRNRNDYVARIQSNPLCYHHLYASWSCMLDNWILFFAFFILAIFIAITICVACWTLFWRTTKNKQRQFNATTVPTTGYVIDYDIEQRDRTQSAPRRAPNVESNHRIKHIDSDVDDNDDEISPSYRQRPAAPTPSPLPLKDYEPPRRFHLQRPSSQSHYSVSNKHRARTRSPPPPAAATNPSRPASVVSVRQIEI